MTTETERSGNLTGHAGPKTETEFLFNITQKTTEEQAISEIKRYLLAICPKGILEIRGFGLKGNNPAWEGWTTNIVSGYFDDHHRAEAAEAAFRLDNAGAEAVSVTLNQPRPELLARCNNRLKSPPKGSTTSDDEVPTLQHLLIDIDSNRDRGISATDEQLAAALELQDKVVGALSVMKWPEPCIVGMSGNGGHIIYRLADLPNYDRNVELVSRCLKALAIKYDTSEAHIDTSVFNPGRMVKILGTMARKGDSTPDHPHRRSVAVTINGSAKPVPFDHLEALAEQAPVDEGKRTSASSRKHSSQGPKDDQAADKKNNADKLVELVRLEGVELFHDKDRKNYATFKRNGCCETWHLQSIEFDRWIGLLFYNAHKKIPNAQARADAMNTLAGIAAYEGREQEVYTRVAKKGDSYYLDLANDKWGVVEISALGWQVIPKSPVKFLRTSSMQPLPTPTSPPDDMYLFTELPQHINIPHSKISLAIAWLLETLRPDTPFPVMELVGEQGSAKSTTQDRLRSLIDPSSVNLRSAPKNREDMYVGAGNNWLVSYNNVSHLKTEQQDALCCMATGGGYAARTLYSNLEETVYDIKRPVIMNGIGGLVTASDLLDRTIKMELPLITPSDRKTETVVNASFQAAWPNLLGALLDCFVKTLQALPYTRIDRLPRMADFVILGEAMAISMGLKSSFMTLYKDNHEESVARSLEDSPVIAALQEFRANNPDGYHGTHKELLNKLENYRNQGANWPKSPKGLSNILQRYAPALRTVGIDYDHNYKRHEDGYRCTINFQKESSASTASTGLHASAELTVHPELKNEEKNVEAIPDDAFGDNKFVRGKI